MASRPLAPLRALSNQHSNVPVDKPTSKLTRQVGKTNLTIRSCSDPNTSNADKQVVKSRPMAMAARSRVIAVPVAEPTFEIYCDSDSESAPSPAIERHAASARLALEAKEVAAEWRGSCEEAAARLEDDSCASMPSQSADSEYHTAHSSPSIYEHDEVIIGVSGFAEDAYVYMRERELTVRPKAHYITKQKDITAEMRTILVDWLSDVTNEFSLQQETLHLAVQLIDRVLSVYAVNRFKLQLIGAACMMIACKYEEIYPPELKDFVYITDETYSGAEILRMERLVLNTVEFVVSTPTPSWFAAQLCSKGRVGRKREAVVDYVLQLTLMDVEFLRFRPSVLAASALALSNIICGETPYPKELEERSRVDLVHVVDVLPHMLDAFRSAPIAKHQSIYEKFCGGEFDIANLPAPDKIPVLD